MATDFAGYSGSRKALDHYEPYARPRARHVLAFSLAALLVLGLTAHPAHAQTILTAADSHIGAAGAPGPGNPNGPGGFYGNYGADGYDFSGFPASSLIVNGPTLTGGAGAELTGTNASNTYDAGNGGAGLVVVGGAATINSGTFIGGVGGMADGVGKNLVGGAGGDALYASYSTTNIYGGTFRGGNSGPASGTGAFGSFAAGNGLNANGSSSTTVNVYGGSFTGGNHLIYSNQSVAYEKDGFGLFDLGGNVNVYGGSFTGGTNSYGDIGVNGGTTTLYGSNFFVNGVAVTSGTVTGSGTITGVFQDNAAPSTFTYSVSFGTLNISAPAVPEASTTVSFGLLLALGLGGLVVVARRKKVAP